MRVKPHHIALQYVSTVMGWDPELILSSEEWYFGHPRTLLEQISTVVKDRDDAVAWDVHEMVEAVLFRKGEQMPLNFRDEKDIRRKDKYHDVASQIELAYLESINRSDLVKQVRAREEVEFCQY